MQRNPLTGQGWAKRLSAGIHDTVEDVKDGANQREYLLHFVLESRLVLDAGEVGSKLYRVQLDEYLVEIPEDTLSGAEVTATSDDVAPPVARPVRATGWM